MPDAPQQAARLTDPVGHGLGIVGMLAGAMLGAVVGAILVLGAIATGGALLIALAVCAAAASIGGAGLAGGQIARALQHACGLPNPTTGALASVGSPNIFIGNKPAARALADMAAACSGLGGVVHFPIPMAPIADGAKTVKFNNLYAARVTSKLVCAAEITMGEPTVVIGGPTIRVLEVTDIEAMLEKGLTYLMWGGIIGAGIVSCFMGWAAALKFAVQFGAIYGLFKLTDLIEDPDTRDLVQGTLGLILVVIGGIRGAKGLGEPEADPLDPNSKSKPPPEEPTPPKETPQERLARIREQQRQARLKQDIADAEAEGKLNDLDPADREWLEDDPTGRRKELAYDPDTKSFKPQEARAALQAEQDGSITKPVRRAYDQSGSSGGADYLDGGDPPKAWDVKDARAGPDMISDTASPKGGQPGENVMVDCSQMSPAEQAALEKDVNSRPKQPGSGDIIFVPKR